MPRPSNQRDRNRARQEAATAAQTREQRARRSRRIVVGIVVVVVVLAAVAGIFGARAGDNSTQSAATTSSSVTTTTAPVTGDASIVAPPAGQTITGQTPCPAEDGSSPRVTSFAGPPPQCIDPAYFYDATVHTSVGDMLLQLNPKEAPNAANNFAVLALYHYYDGQPFDKILADEAGVVNARFADQPDTQSPGYTIPGENRDQIFVTGSLCMIPDVGAADNAYSGAFLIATFERAVDLPQNLTQFGVMLDGQDALIAINKAGSQSGGPTQSIVINSIDISRSVSIN